MLVIDIDGVVANSEPVLVAALEKYTGEKFKPPTPRTYDFRDGFSNLDLKDCLGVIDNTLIQEVNNIEIYYPKETYLALALVQKYFGRVRFLTARHKNVEDSTHAWLKKHFGSLNYELNHVQYNSADKKDWLLKSSPNIIVEDRLKTVNILSNIGIATYLIEQEWNINRETHKDVYRVTTLLDAVDNILTWV